jgi:y4mF family transcriptional regulator
MSDLAEMIRFHRKKSGLSQAELAALSNLGKTVILDIEKGKKTIKLDTLMKVCGVLNIRIQFSSPLMEESRELK